MLGPKYLSVTAAASRHTQFMGNLPPLPLGIPTRESRSSEMLKHGTQRSSQQWAP